jgi:hypothetical protein
MNPIFSDHDTTVSNSTFNILENLRDRLMERTKTLASDLFRIRGFWDVALLFQPTPQERLFSYSVHIAQTSREGCCYAFPGKRETTFNILGADARTIHTGDNYIDIAVLDSAYAVVSPEPDAHYIITGSSTEKAERRAQLIADEVDRCLTSSTSRRVAVIGTLGILLSELQRRACHVTTTDLDDDLIGTQLHGILVEDGRSKTLHEVEHSDVAVVTGMTLATNTLGPIIDIAHQAHTQLILIAETGAWFASAYRDSYYIATVISEPFPFYIFSGPSEINIYRRRSIP